MGYRRNADCLEPTPGAVQGGRVMGIYIKGVEMPKDCSVCQMLEGDATDGMCHAANRWLDDDEYWVWCVDSSGEIYDDKPCNCPLVEVPDHGADAKELRESNTLGENFTNLLRRCFRNTEPSYEEETEEEEV